MFTFLHAADIHLDSPLRGLDRYEGAPVDEIRNATRRALENLVRTAIDEKAAFLVIAGDLYDGDWPDVNTGLYFVSQMVRLKDEGIPVYVVAGNHDAANRMTRSLPLPENVKLFSTQQPESALLEKHGVAIHGQSFADQCTTSDLARNYPPSSAGYFNVGVLHTSLSGREGHDSYAPCSEDCLRAKGYDYWALGHVHNREIVSSDPMIAFSGNLQGRHIRETGPKGCLIVSVANDGSVNAGFRALDVFRWQHIHVDLSEVCDENEVTDKVVAGLKDAQQQADGRPLAVRIDLVGRSSVHLTLNADLRRLTDEIRALATNIGSGTMWVEKVRIQTTSIPSKARPVELAEGPLTEISALVSELRSSPEMRDDLGADFADLMRKLPPSLSHVIRPSDTEWCLTILDAVESRLIARLRG